MPETTTRTVNDSALEVFYQVMRSGRPGPWASDHFEQSKHFTGVPYVVVDAIATSVASANVRLMQRVEGGKDGRLEGVAGKPKAPPARSFGKAMTQAGAQESDEKWAPLDPDHPAWKPFREPNPQQFYNQAEAYRLLNDCAKAAPLYAKAAALGFPEHACP